MITGYSNVTSVTTSGLDADARAFLIASGTYNNITIGNAINTFVVGLKAQGLWSFMDIIYPIVGGTAFSHKWNLKSPFDTNSAFRLTFSGGWTHDSNGMNGNGSGYAETYFVPSVNGVQNQHISENQIISNVDANTQEIGVEESPNGELSHWMRVFGGSLARVYGGQSGVAISDSRGFQLSQREDASNCRIYKYGVNNTPYAATYLGVRPNNGLILGAKRIGGSIGGYSNRPFNYISVGNAIDPLKLDTYALLVLQLQTNLGR
jgi:hypothetical protein